MGPTGRALVRALTWPLVPALMIATIAMQLQAPPSVPLLAAGDVPYLVATFACWLVGVMLTGRAFRQPAGWAFLGLGTSLAWSGLTDTYAQFALVWRPSAAGGRLAATLSDSSYVWWFVFLTLALVHTRPAGPARRAWGLLPQLTVGAGVAYQAAALLRSTHLDPPYQTIASPAAIRSLSGPIVVFGAAAIVVVGLCVVASAVGLVRAWRRSEGEARQQLLWLVAGTLPLAPCVIASFAVSYAGHSEVAGYLMSAAIVALAVGAALSVLRYRLYDVERVVSESAGYAIASAAVVVIFVAVVAVVRLTTPIDTGSPLVTVLATLAGVGAARASYVWGRRAVERRVNRVRFDAVETMRRGLAAATPDLDAVLAEALGDPSARFVYPAEGGAWVTSEGREVQTTGAAVDVSRRGTVAARIEFDAALNEPAVVEAVARTSAAEVDNVALRAELARQVEEISESRSRLATAQLEERTRIERDLHDGAQQRLLAIALQLRSAQVNGGEAVLRNEVDRAIDDLGATVQELRDLAGGLQPAALAGGGLPAAVVDLVTRIPLDIRHDVVEQRFAPSVEGAAWFVIAEAVSNAVKHASAETVSITVKSDASLVRVVVADSGVGGARAGGHGLQGLADRVAAVRGTLRVTENVPRGTIVEAELPCA